MNQVYYDILFPEMKIEEAYSKMICFFTFTGNAAL